MVYTCVERWSCLQRARKGLADGDDAKADFRAQVTQVLATLSEERARHKTKEEETKMQKPLRYSSRLKSKSGAAKASGKQSVSFQLPSPQMKEGVVMQCYMTEMMLEEKTLRSLLTSIEM